MISQPRVVAQVRDALAVRRAERDARTQLEREVGSFVSDSDRLELEAVLERYTNEDAAAVREALDRQTLAAQAQVSLATHHAA